MNKLLTFIALSSLSLAVVACEDPAATAESAKVGSAKPVPPPPSAKAPAGSAAGGAGSAAPAPTGDAPKADAKPAKPDGGLTVSLADSKVEFTGSKVSGKHDGKFQTFEGWIFIDGDKLESARMFIEIDVGSLKTDSEKLDGHLKTDDFFAVEKHPKATFQLTELKAEAKGGATHSITGNLKLRGVEKSVTFPAKVSLKKGEIGATAEFKINRKDWGIAYEGKKDDLIRDEVVIKLDIKAKG